MLRELTEYGNNIKEEMKVTLSVIKKYQQGTSSKEKETGTQIINLERMEEINIQLEQKVEKRIKKKNPKTSWLVWLSGLSAGL